ncbi:MAG: Asp-tRNA(Asn)/Glu-tRNA(Gln) amidotransferase subunit GatB [Patescibacteria group bacterium]|nr:Asp-tRNA(Asn)/Glu-tRNA(Gln) amidotransferase subunit GatB [Patescibacteria group bacterium]
MKYTPTIGMEIHVELQTKSKMFCGCPSNHFKIKPNTHTCPVCLGLPGALPVPNKKAIDWTILAGLAINCSINKISKFDRKHYFYPDLSKGYQISQYDQPLCEKGFVNLDSGGKININRIHLEEDTAKLIHKTIKGKKVSLVDFNRSGVALMEIVTEPDITSGKQAKEFLKKLHSILKVLKISDCSMEKGSMRLEANISLSKTAKLADYKIEVKNLNSFKFVEQAINFEIKRQTKLLEKGIKPKQETRGFNSKTKSTFSQRIKESAEDYRYFPDPDIPPMHFTDKDIAEIKSKLPKLPDQQIKELDLPNHLAKLLVKKPTYLDYFNNHLSDAKKLKLSSEKFANFIINKKINISKPCKPQLIKLTKSIDVGPAILLEVIKENPEVVKKFKTGKTNVIGFLVGQVMKKTKGQANPKQAQKQLLIHLQGPSLQATSQ